MNIEIIFKYVERYKYANHYTALSYIIGKMEKQL